MFFSIIIPTYNRSEFIKLSVDSILSQNFEDLEIIIVDDGSEDDTEEVIKTVIDPRIKYLKTTNRERGAARNYGLTFSKGEYIDFFDSDDVFLPCLFDVKEFIMGNNKPPVIYGDFQQLDSSSNLIKKEFKPYSTFTQNLLHNNFLACGSVFLRREVAQQFPFHEDRRLSTAEDWELWLRIHVSYPFIYFPRDIFQQVQHVQRSLVTVNPETVKIRDTYFATLILSNEAVVKHYKYRAINLFVADRYTFIALSYCKQSSMLAFRYLKKSFLTSFMIVKRKRFWAVLKKIILG